MDDAEPPGTTSEGPPPLTELEGVVLDFSLGFTQKMLKVCGILDRNPARAASRLAEVIGVFTKIYARWQWEEKRNTAEDERKRGAYLRDGIAQLGPVFVKIAQTLSTRPDIIGDEAADSLLVLQDQMGPFDSKTAYAIIKQELQWEGPIVRDPAAESDGPTPLFSELTPEPIAAASIGQVYKGKLMDGRQVAVKVQRPGMVSKIALDMYIVRQLLDWLEKSGFNGSEDLPIIVDEVGAAIFYELDYRCEAQNADDFAESLRMLDFVKVPATVKEFTARRTLVQEWINGRPMKQLSIEEQRKMVQMGVTCSSTQLLRTGIVHADPHEGNMLFTDDGKLAMLDFGLMCRVENDKQEAMAACILNILNANWEGVVDDLRVIGILPPVASVWTNDAGERIKFEAGTVGQWVDLSDPEFKAQFREAMSSGLGGDQKRNFTQLVMDLTVLSGMYRFCLPPYMVFIIRSITTLDFCAVRTNCNMYEVAAPVAIWRALTPRTAAGRNSLKEALLTPTGEINWEKLLDLADSKGAEAQQQQASAAGGGDNAMMELLNTLIVSPEGAALRRVAFSASPKALIPPKSMRPALVAQAQAAFRATVRQLSLWKLVQTAAGWIRKKLDQDEERCELVEEDDGRVVCRRNVERRRQRIVSLMLRNKLVAPGGFVTSVKLLGLMLWILVNVIKTSVLDTLKFVAFDWVRVMFRAFTRKQTDA